MSNSAFTPAVLTISSGTGSGSGEKNYITNPSMASATTGWNVVGDFTLTRTTAASELPREYTTATGIKLVATSGTQSTADYMYFDFNLDDVDLGKKLKIQWSQKKIGTYSAGQLAVVITSQADRTTALITPQTTAIPASDLDFVISFDSTTTAALSLVIRATADMTTGDGICISDVIVGPGQIVQGFAGGDFESTASYTIVGSTTNPTAGSGATFYRRTVRDGSYAIIRWEFSQSNAGTAGSGTYSLPLPAGLTIDFNRVNPVTLGYRGNVGSGVLFAGSTAYKADLNATSAISSTSIAVAIFNETQTYSDWGSSLGALSTATVRFGIEARIPIAEWAGNGTVNLGPGAQQEFVFNSSATATDDTTSFGYGPQGAAIQSFAPGATASVTKRVRFQYPIQSDDVLTLELRNTLSATNPWISINEAGSSFVGYGTLGTPGTATHFYGAILNRVAGSATDVDVSFYGSGAYVGAAWSFFSSFNWRVRKAKASSPVGFSRASPATGFGLVAPRRGQQSLTVTATAGSWSTVRAVGIYYQDQDGNHRLKFNIVGTCTSSARTSNTLTVSGVTFKNVTTYLQAVSGFVDVAGGVVRAFANANASSIICDHSSLTTSLYSVSGDVELESAPTWA